MLTHQELVSLLSDNFASEGWAIAFQPIKGYDLQATKLWNKSLITFLFRPFDGDALRIKQLTDYEFGRLLAVKRNSWLGAKISVLGHLSLGPEVPHWIPKGIKRSDFLKRSYVVNWVIDVPRRKVLRNTSLPVVRPGKAEIEAALAGRRACPIAP